MSRIPELTQIYEVALMREATEPEEETGHPGTSNVYSVRGEDFHVQVSEDDEDTIAKLIEREQRTAEMETALAAEEKSEPAPEPTLDVVLEAVATKLPDNANGKDVLHALSQALKGRS